MTEADIEEFLAAEQTSVSINHDGEVVVEPSDAEACEITKPRVRSLHTSEDEGYLEVQFGVRMRLPRERMLVEGGDGDEQDDSHGGETWTDGSPATESSGVAEEVRSTDADPRSSADEAVPSGQSPSQSESSDGADPVEQADSDEDEDDDKITFSMSDGPPDNL